MSDAHIIIAGDSNALGYLNTGPAPYTPTWQVQIWARQADGSYNWNYMNPGMNTGTPANPGDWGPEVAIANRWLSSHAGDGSVLWIVKDDLTVKGGTTLAVDWAPSSGAYFASTAQAAADAMRNLSGGAHAFDHYDAGFVVLGENDAEVSADAQAYGTNLAAFDAAARGAWGAGVLLESRIEDTMGAPADNQAVRVGQWSADVADPLMASVKTIGFEQQPDLVHYDATGQLQLGGALFDAWAAI
ncbi:MAG: hypothetical protein JSR98_06695 [Proteobacteria bacterium]|nr:hypothetical protein [Pseudomonadota bacterium]